MTSKQITELFVIWLGFRSCADFGPLQVPSWGGELLLTRADPGQSDFNNVGTQPSVPKQIDLQPDPQPSLGVIYSCEQPKHLSSCTEGRPMEAGWGTVLNLPGLHPSAGSEGFSTRFSGGNSNFKAETSSPWFIKPKSPLYSLDEGWLWGAPPPVPLLWCGERSGLSSVPKPDPLFRRCLCWWQMVMLSWWICYLLDDMQYVCILTVRGETPAVPPVIDSKELFSLLTELRSISIILATRRGFIIMFIIWEKSLWCGTGWVFSFFLLLCSCSLPLLTLQTVACSSGKERGGNLGSSHPVPKRAPLLPHWWKWQNPTFFLLKQWGRQERKDCFRVMWRKWSKRSCLASCAPGACWSHSSLTEFGSHPLLFGKEK